eukprot:7501539-Alexandrium_andersonii.AAC.1
MEDAMTSEPPERARSDLEQAFGSNPEVSAPRRARTLPRAVQNLSVEVEVGRVDNRTSTSIPAQPVPTGVAGVPVGMTADQALEAAVARL